MTFEQLHIWLMAFFRSGGLLLLAPVFSGKMIPVPIRIAMAAFLAYVVSGLARAAVPMPVDIVGLIFSAGHELLIGLMMGLWFLSISCAQYVAGVVAQFASVETVGGQVTNLKVSLDTYAGVFWTIGLVSIGIGVVLFAVSPFIKKWMHGVK